MQCDQHWSRMRTCRVNVKQNTTAIRVDMNNVGRESLLEPDHLAAIFDN